MCGIVGVVGHRIAERELRRAIDALHHRGPDGSGVYLNPAEPVALGHARLSIIDLEGGAQPLYSEDGDLVLVCNGEIYDFERIREELKCKGHRFATHSDSEVIIHLYQEHGLDFVRQLRGEFAFLLYDKRDETLLAVRDRFGIKPLFFNEQDGKYLFASEAKALFATGALQPRTDVAAIRNCLSLVIPDSIFQGVNVVFPGCMLKVDVKAGTHEVIRYWDVDLHADAPPYADLQQAIPAVREAVEEAVRLRLRADVPVGVYLSGGIDSAIVAATVSQVFSGTLKVFTIAFPEDDVFNEYQLAKKMASRIGAEFHAVTCDHSALLEHTAGSLWINELPFFNFHGVGKYMLSALARQHVTVVLTGEGSDEVFLGYGVFGRIARRAPSASPKPPKEGTLARTMYDSLGFVPAPALRVLFSRPVQGLVRRFFHSRRRRELRESHPFDVMRQRLDRKQVEVLPPLRRMQYLWIKSVLPQYLLTMLGDRSELAHSIEGRTPFLDHHLFERARRIPDHFKIHGHVEKHVLREAFKDDIIEEVYRRKKWVYAAPPLWIRKGTHARLDELIDRHLSREAIERSGIFSFRAVRILQWTCSVLLVDCAPKRVINELLVFILTVQVLDRQYGQDFERMLEQRRLAHAGAAT